MSNDLTQRAERLEGRLRDLGWESHGDVIRDLLARLQQEQEKHDEEAYNDMAVAVETLRAEVARLRAKLDVLTGLDALSESLDKALGADTLQARAEAAEAEVARLRAAMGKVRAHTSYLPGARRELLQGLLGSVERIVDAELHESADGGPTR